MKRSLNAATALNTIGETFRPALAGGRGTAITCQIEGLTDGAVTIFARNHEGLAWVATATGAIAADGLVTVDAGCAEYMAKLTTADTGAGVTAVFGAS